MQTRKWQGEEDIVRATKFNFAFLLMVFKFISFCYRTSTVRGFGGPSCPGCTHNPPRSPLTPLLCPSPYPQVAFQESRAFGGPWPEAFLSPTDPTPNFKGPSSSHPRKEDWDYSSSLLLFWSTMPSYGIQSKWFYFPKPLKHFFVKNLLKDGEEANCLYWFSVLDQISAK